MEEHLHNNICLLIKIVNNILSESNHKHFRLIKLNGKLHFLCSVCSYYCVPDFIKCLIKLTKIDRVFLKHFFSLFL